MQRFHINEVGLPAPCQEQPGSCPQGDLEHHYGSAQEALHAQEAEAVFLSLTNGSRPPEAVLFSRGPKTSPPPARAASSSGNKRPVQRHTSAQELLEQAHRQALSGEGSTALFTMVAQAPEHWLALASHLQDDGKWTLEAFKGGLSPAEAQEIHDFLALHDLLNVIFDEDWHYRKLVELALAKRAQQALASYESYRGELEAKTGFAFSDSMDEASRPEQAYVEGSAYTAGVALISRVYEDESTYHMSYDDLGKARSFAYADESPYSFDDPRTRYAILFEKEKHGIAHLYKHHAAALIGEARLRNYSSHGQVRALR